MAGSRKTRGAAVPVRQPRERVQQYMNVIAERGKDGWWRWSLAGMLWRWRAAEDWQCQRSDDGAQWRPVSNAETLREAIATSVGWGRARDHYRSTWGSGYAGGAPW